MRPNLGLKYVGGLVHPFQGIGRDGPVQLGIDVLLFHSRELPKLHITFQN